MSPSTCDPSSVGRRSPVESVAAPRRGSICRLGLKLAAVCPLFMLGLFAAGKARAQDGYYMNQGAKFDSRGDFDGAIGAV